MPKKKKKKKVKRGTKSKTRRKKVPKRAAKSKRKQTKKEKSTAYKAKDIYVLKGLEPIRKRPAMYIGTTGPKGVHHLIWEVVGNSIDEAIMGHCTEIEVSLLPENRVKVIDNGRGIPVDRHPQTKKSALETVMTTLHAGAKFGGKVYTSTGGLHGIGISAVCALSTPMRVEVCRDGFRYFQEYSRGKAKTKLKKLTKCRETGTTVIFEPDPQIFREIKFDPKKILGYLRRQAYLTKGIKITFLDSRTDDKKTYTFYFEGGLISYVRYLTRGAALRQRNVFYGSGEKDGIIVEAAFRYSDEYETLEEGFANNIFTSEGGSHITGFRTALTRTLNDYARKNKFIREKEDNLGGQDIREGLTSVVSVKIKDPQFEGQTKRKLGNPEARSAVEAVVSETLYDFLERNPRDAKAVIENAILAQKARKAARAAKETVLRKGVLEGLALPGKLADCSSRNPAESELFIVEGESAGGSSRQARDRHFQAILPLRGKILNVERARLDKILSSKEIKSLIIALGTAIAEDFDLDKIRYHRIVIMTDADSITGDTPILLYDKQKEEFFLTEARTFIENCSDTRRYKVLTYNSKNKKRELKEIYQTIRHPLRTLLYEIKTYCGYPIKVTACHSVYVFENGKIRTKKGEEIKEGDILVFPKSLPRQAKDYSLDLKNVILNSNFDNISIKIPKQEAERIPMLAWCQLNQDSWTKLQRERELAGISRRAMGEMIGVYDKVIQQWEQKIDNVMPRFHQFKDYLDHLEIDFNTLKYNTYIPLNEWNREGVPSKAEFYLKNHTRKLIVQFKVDTDLAYLIGFYLGDGCATPQKRSPNRFSLSLNKEKAERYLRRLSKIIKKKFHAKPIIEKREPNNIQLHFHSFEFKLLLKKLNLLGKRCNEKFIPSLFFNVKKEIQESLLEGLLHSDGFITVWPKREPRKAIYGWRLSSKGLIQGILIIFRQWGIFPAYGISQSKDHPRKDGKIIRSNFKSYDLSISTVQYLLTTKNVWANHKDALKLQDYLKKVDYKKATGKYIKSLIGEFVGLKVRDIKKVRSKDKFVYDFSVFGDQNFIAGPAGVLLHNSDGNHIKTLLLTLFFRYFRPVIEAGYLYIAQPPLYRIQAGKRMEYAYTEADKEEILDSMKKDKVSGASLQRYKGLGEMNPDQLWKTTMDPENRVLLKVEIEDANEADKIFDVLMGKEVLPRKRFIQTHAKKVKNLDV
jgi:DNA gyrase subunit B